MTGSKHQLKDYAWTSVSRSCKALKALCPHAEKYVLQAHIYTPVKHTHTHTHTMGDGVCSDTGGCQFKPHALTALPPHSIATPLCHTLTIPLPFTD